MSEWKIRTGQVRASQVIFGQGKSTQDRSSHVKTGHVMSCQKRLSQVRTGRSSQFETVKFKLQQVKYDSQNQIATGQVRIGQARAC